MFDMNKQEELRINSIVKAVNNRLNLNLRLVRKLDFWNINLRNEKGKDFVIVCYGPTNNNFFVRSLLRRNRQAKMTWFCNGQPASGCVAIQEWQEGEFLVEDPMPTLNFERRNHAMPSLCLQR
jgi:hypothetical protein